MVSALVFAPPGRLEALGRTLAVLVSGVTSGAVADAVVIVPARDPEVEAVAEFAGASTVLLGDADPWAAGARLARRELVLCLEAGDVLEGEWRETLDHFAGSCPGKLGRFRRRGAGFSLRAAEWREWAFGAGRPRPGDVLPRSLAAGGRLRPFLRPLRLGATVASTGTAHSSRRRAPSSRRLAAGARRDGA